MKNQLITLFMVTCSSYMSLFGQQAILKEMTELKLVGVPFQPAEVLAFESADIDSRNYLAGLKQGVILSLNQDVIESLLKDRNEFVQVPLAISERDEVVLTLKRNEIFTSEFTLSASSDPVNPIAYIPGVHYRGIVEGDPSSVVAFSVFNDQVMGLISTDQGNFVIGKINHDTANRHIFYNEKDLERDLTFACETPDDGIGYTTEQLEHITQGRDVNDCVRLYVEINNDIVVDKGGVIPATDYITGLYNQCFVLFANESINMMINGILAWTAPSPYHSGSASQKLSSYQANTSFFNADLSQLLGYSADGVAAGFSGICNANPDLSKCYSGIIFLYWDVPTFSQSVYFVCHELGHLLGSRHTHACAWNGNNTAIDGCAGSEGNCPDGPLPPAGTVMSYCMQVTGIDFNLGFGPQPGNVIRNSVNASGNCLTPCGPPSAYCLSYGLVSNNKYIKKVVLGSINNTTGNNYGYGNYISLNTNVTAGNSYTIALTPGSNSSTKYWRVWIDYNGDQDWDDAGELAGQKTGSQVVSIPFTVPVDASILSARMRVSMAYNTYASNCGSFPTGEVEDYTVNIQPPQGANITTDVADLQSYKGAMVYPNPVNDVLQIPIDGEIQSIRLISLDGKDAILIHDVNKHQLEVDELSPGIYFLLIQSAGQWYQAKFSKI